MPVRDFRNPFDFTLNLFQQASDEQARAAQMWSESLRQERLLEEERLHQAEVARDKRINELADLADERAYNQGLASLQNAGATAEGLARAAQTIPRDSPMHGVINNALDLINQGSTLQGSEAAQYFRDLQVPIPGERPVSLPELMGRVSGATGEAQREREFEVLDYQQFLQFNQMDKGHALDKAMADYAHAHNLSLNEVRESFERWRIQDQRDFDEQEHRLNLALTQLHNLRGDDPDVVSRRESTLNRYKNVLSPERYALLEAEHHALSGGTAAIERQMELMNVDRTRQIIASEGLSMEETQARLDAFYDERENGRRMQFVEWGTNFDALSEDDRRELISSIEGVNNERDLQAWGKTRFERQMRIGETLERREQLQNERLEEEIPLLGQQYSINKENLTQAQWENERTRRLSGFRDAQEFADTVGTAYRLGDVATLQILQHQLNTPGSLVGEQMKQWGVSNDMLQEFVDEARELKALDMRKSDLEMQGMEQALEAGVVNISIARTNLESAQLALQQRRELTADETEALRAQFKYQAAESYRMMSNMAFDEAFQRTSDFFQLADAVPADFWDSVPAPLQASLDAMNIDTQALRSRSILSDIMREHPIRQEGWDQFRTYFQAAPDEAGRAAAISGADTALLQAGVTDGRLRQGLLNVLEAAWEQDDREWALQYMTSMSKLVAGGVEGMSLDDIKKLADAQNSLASTKKQQVEGYISHLVSVGCAIQAAEGIPPRLQYGGIANDGSSCDAMFPAYQEFRQQYDLTAEAQARTVAALANQYGMPTEFFYGDMPDHFLNPRLPDSGYSEMPAQQPQLPFNEYRQQFMTGQTIEGMTNDWPVFDLDKIDQSTITLDTFMEALGQHESGGNYNATGQNVPGQGRAQGKYQIMPANWPQWSQEALGAGSHPQTPANQEKVARYKLQQYARQSAERNNGITDWGEVALAWFSGPGTAARGTKNADMLKPDLNGVPQPHRNYYVGDILTRAASRQGSPEVVESTTEPESDDFSSEDRDLARQAALLIFTLEQTPENEARATEIYNQLVERYGEERAQELVRSMRGQGGRSGGGW